MCSCCCPSSMTRPPQSWQPQSLLKSAPPHGSAGDEEAALNAPAMRTQSSQAASCWPLRLCVTPRLPRGSTCSSGSTIMCYVPAISEQIFEKPSAGGIGWPDSPSQMPQTPLGTSSLSEDMAEAGERKAASRTKTARAEQTSGVACSACDVSAARACSRSYRSYTSIKTLTLRSLPSRALQNRRDLLERRILAPFTRCAYVR